MFNYLSPMNRNAFSVPGYKRGFQADSGSYAAQPSLNYSQQQMQAPLRFQMQGYGGQYGNAPQYGGQFFGANAPQYFGNPMYGGDQMLGTDQYSAFVPAAYRYPGKGRRLSRFTPYQEQVQPFAGME